VLDLKSKETEQLHLLLLGFSIWEDETTFPAGMIVAFIIYFQNKAY
jgi:hypothetical protein